MIVARVAPWTALTVALIVEVIILIASQGDFAASDPLLVTTTV